MIHITYDNNIIKYMFGLSIIHTKNNLPKPSVSKNLALQSVIGYIKLNVLMCMSQSNSVELRHKISSRVQHSHISTTINGILEQNPIKDKLNVLKSIMKRNSLYENLKCFGRCLSKLSKLKISLLITW